jgi:hypothetical protein
MTAIITTLDSQLETALKAIDAISYNDVISEFHNNYPVADDVDMWLCGVGNGVQDVSDPAYVAGRLMLFLLERAREVTVMSCVEGGECDDGACYEEYISDYSFDQRAQKFRDQVCLIAAEGVMSIARQSQWIMGGMADANTSKGARHPAIERGWLAVQDAVRCYWTHDYNNAEWRTLDPLVQRLAYA